MGRIKGFEQLQVYQRAFEAAMTLFGLSKQWPKEERYAMTDPIRRSSRSVCSNLAEAWSKRRYPAHFVSKLSDAEQEAAETTVWLRFALRCGYLDRKEFDQLIEEYDFIRGGLINMMQQPDKWCGPSNQVKEDEISYDLL